MLSKKSIVKLFNNFLIDIKQINENYFNNFKINEVEKIDKPLILISQIQRSGGTLLNQLFDNHFEMFVYPCELMIGKPKWLWPVNLNKMSISKAFNFLFSHYLSDYILNGYYNEGVKKNKYEFNLIRRRQKIIFYKLMKSSYNLSNREIINIYFTSFFNSLLNYQINTEQKYIIAFVPRLIMYSESVENYLKDYNNGKIISIIRDPVNWYLSAKRHGNQYKDIEYSMKLWNNCFDSIISNKYKFKNRMKIILFENLLSNTELIMKDLSNWLELNWDKNLLTPSFFGKPIKADSSFQNTKIGVIKEPLNRNIENNLKEINLIKNLTKNRYEKFKEKNFN